MGDGCPHQFSREPCGVGARPGAQPGALRSGTFQAGQGEPRPQACFAAAAPRRDWEEGEQPRLAGGGPGEHSRAAAEPLCPALVAAVERDPPLPASRPSAPSLPWAQSSGRSTKMVTSSLYAQSFLRSVAKTCQARAFQGSGEQGHLSSQ